MSTGVLVAALHFPWVASLPLRPYLLEAGDSICEILLKREAGIDKSLGSEQP